MSAVMWQDDTPVFLDDEAQAFQQIIEDRQRRAHEIAQRIRLGTATTTDADWIDAEYGNY
jgi:hypothetical protein